MKMKVYSILDSKTGAYGVPFFNVNKDVALRSFMDLTRDERSMASRHPQDYHLFEIGEFDDVTAEITGCSPVALGSGTQFSSRLMSEVMKSVGNSNQRVVA